MPPNNFHVVGSAWSNVDIYVDDINKVRLMLEKPHNGCLKSLTNICGDRDFNVLVTSLRPHYMVITGFTEDHPYRSDGFFEYKEDKFVYIGQTYDDVLCYIMYHALGGQNVS
jgi:hypothetical protein